MICSYLRIGTNALDGFLVEYTYDANGNRLSKTLNSGTPSTYTYADDDRLLTTPHGTITYDAAGRPTAYPISSTVTRYFTWDYDDRMLGYSNTSGALVDAHKYNGAGARVEFSSGGTTRKDLRTGIGVTAPVVSSAVGGSTTVSYLPGIAEQRGSTKSYQHSGLKNVDAQSNSSATISATREYDAFGGEVTASSTGTFNGPFGHAGSFGYQSEGSGLQLLGHRWYDPEVGRFLTRDPIQHGGNWFAYCSNNPLGRVDPHGLKDKSSSWQAGEVRNESDRNVEVLADVGSGKKRRPVQIPIPPGWETNPDKIDADYIIDPNDGKAWKLGTGITTVEGKRGGRKGGSYTAEGNWEEDGFRTGSQFKYPYRYDAGCGDPADGCFNPPPGFYPREYISVEEAKKRGYIRKSPKR